MSQRTQGYVWFCLAMLLIGAVGYARWYVVDQAQDRLFGELRAVFAQKAASFLPQPGRELEGGLSAVPADSLKIARQKVLIAVLNRNGMFVSIVVLFCVCLWVAYETQNFALTAMMGAWGWLVSATVAAALAFANFALYVELRATLTTGIASFPTRNVPFGLLLVTSLVTTLPLHALVPTLGGWGLGWGVREWRKTRLPFDTLEYAREQDPRPEPVRCSCGTLNVGNATACYACGAELREVLTGTVPDE